MYMDLAIQKVPALWEVTPVQDLSTQEVGISKKLRITVHHCASGIFMDFLLFYLFWCFSIK